MIKIVAVYGSPRRKGNTSLLLKKAVQGAREAGTDVEEIVLRDLKISPCLEITDARRLVDASSKMIFTAFWISCKLARALFWPPPFFLCG